MNRIPVITLVLILAAFGGFPRPAGAQETARPKGAVSLNQGFVEGLYGTVKLDDEMAVFAHVFNTLPDKVTVYPTENYFYWSFTANGRTIWGNFRLDASDRDKGILNLGYFEYDENGKFQDYDGWEKSISAKDGMVLKKISRFVYAITYKGRTVTFTLNDIGMAPPKKAKLAPGEVYVGPVFDESGVKFFLVFAKPTNHFIYVVNEDGAPPETFKKLKDGLTVIGRRTGFAYYLDKPNARKILIAINGANARRNNYYDGPFDQLPDNYADQTRIKKYLELAYPHIKGKIDKYGVLKGEKGNRVAVGSYHIYTSEDQLTFVASCAKTHKPTTAKFYACITPDGG
ncbi:MAG: hypothetical protein ACTSUD_03700 [Alphaproteobacteria bacterium]